MDAGVCWRRRADRLGPSAARLIWGWAGRVFLLLGARPVQCAVLAHRDRAHVQRVRCDQQPRSATTTTPAATLLGGPTPRAATTTPPCPPTPHTHMGNAHAHGNTLLLRSRQRHWRTTSKLMRVTVRTLVGSRVCLHSFVSSAIEGHAWTIRCRCTLGEYDLSSGCRWAKELSSEEAHEKGRSYAALPNTTIRVQSSNGTTLTASESIGYYGTDLIVALKNGSDATTEERCRGL